VFKGGPPGAINTIVEGISLSMPVSGVPLHPDCIQVSEGRILRHATLTVLEGGNLPPSPRGHQFPGPGDDARSLLLHDAAVLDAFCKV